MMMMLDRDYDDGEQNPNTNNKNTEKKLMVNAKKQILDAFEANAFSEHDLRLARERWMGSGGGGGGGAVANSGSGSKRRRVSDVMELEANGAAAGEGGGYFGLKYLTSSRLLRLQLRDPTLRLQVGGCLERWGGVGWPVSHSVACTRHPRRM